MIKVLQKIRNKIKFKGKYANCTLAKNVEIVNSSLGQRVNIAHDASIINAIINDFSSIGRYTKIQDVTIGKYCSVSWDVTIGAKEHPITTISTHSFPYNKLFNLTDKSYVFKKNTTIVGNDVWIGCGAIIKSGISIGDGAIIGAGAVVTKDVEPYSVVGGIPAKIIKYRFSKEIINDLLEIKWWDFNPEIIKKNIWLFQENISTEILNKIRELKDEEI